jgi:hypothetical protein
MRKKIDLKLKKRLKQDEKILEEVQDLIGATLIKYFNNLKPRGEYNELLGSLLLSHNDFIIIQKDALQHNTLGNKKDYDITLYPPPF